MTFFSALPTPETQIGLAIESTRGTPVAPTAWLPANGPKYKPNLAMLDDKTLRGSMVDDYELIPGLRFDSHGWDTYPYMDTLPNYLRACLGSKDTKTVAPASTELVAEAAAGATMVEVKKTIAAGSYVAIGSGATIETHLTGAVVEKSSEHFEITLPYPLAFKQANKATVTGLTKHKFSLLNNEPEASNQPPSYTLTDFAGETNWRQLAAAQLNSLNISGSADALPKVTVDWMSNLAITPSKPTASYSTAAAAPGWTVTASIGGTQIGYLVSWDVDLKRNVKNVPAITGNQNYYQHYAGALVTAVKLTVLENSEATWLNAYTEGATETLDLNLFDTTNGWLLNLHSSKCKFTAGDLDRSKEYVEIPLEMRLLPNATDATAGGVSPLSATVANAVTTEY